MGRTTTRMMRQRPGDARGFTYIAALIFVAIMGVWLAAVGEVWSASLQREKEAELLFAGNQFRNAIAMYYAHTPGQSGRYPMSLDDLVKDPRYPATKRYLRRIYLDPILNSTKWELINGPNGEILGVHSASGDEPIKKGNFGHADQEFEGKTKYSDWVFAISPRYFPAPSSTSHSGTPLRRGTGK